MFTVDCSANGTLWIPIADLMIDDVKEKQDLFWYPLHYPSEEECQTVVNILNGIY